MIEQRTDHDCVFCCAAMALGLSYEQAQEKAGAAFMALLEGNGCSNAMENALLKALGLRMNVDYCMRSVANHWTTVGFAKNMLWGRRAIVTVRSKNLQDGRHAIYWDGWAVHDPSMKERFASWEEIEPIELVLFNERAGLSKSSVDEVRREILGSAS